MAGLLHPASHQPTRSGSGAGRGRVQQAALAADEGDHPLQRVDRADGHAGDDLGLAGVAERDDHPSEVGHGVEGGVVGRKTLPRAFGAVMANLAGVLGFADAAFLIRDAVFAESLLGTGPYVIFDIPLLVESGTWRDRVGSVLVVDCPETVQVARVMARNALPEQQVRAIMEEQREQGPLERVGVQRGR